jgi:hypothetical protein
MNTRKPMTEHKCRQGWLKHQFWCYKSSLFTQVLT